MSGSSRSSPSVETGTAATAAVNVASLRFRFVEQGSCVEVDPCFGDDRMDRLDDCLAETEERAWASPIFVEQREGATE